MQNYIFEVNKEDLSKTRIAHQSVTDSLALGEVLLEIDKFALTANNITYGVTGDMLGYWRFFPCQKGWGRLPVMGFANVVASNCAEIEVGERVWGFFPMGRYLVIKAGRVSETGFSDMCEHRSGLSPVYSRFERVANNPFYQADTEDYQMLLKGLYTTSWLIDDFMSDHQYFGAEQYLITSASSKTSMALAFAAKQRGEKPCIGLTSSARVKFVESLRLYEKVISYDEIDALDANIATICVDMAGSAKVLSAIHHHFNEQLKFSSRVGATHIKELFTGGKLAGPEPIMFFAPHQIEKRSKEWGTERLMINIAQSLNQYIDFARSKIEIKSIGDVNTLKQHYLALLAGKNEADKGLIVKLSDSLD